MSYSREEWTAIWYRRFKADFKGEAWPMDRDTLRKYRELTPEQRKELRRTYAWKIAAWEVEYRSKRGR